MEYGHIVLASTKSGFVPNAIKWFTDSQFSHSLVITPDMLGVPMCIEAASSGVDALRFDLGYKNNLDQGYEVWSINISQEIKDNAIRSILNELQISYGFLQYPWFIWRKINKIFGKDIKSQDNWFLSGMICSQLCVAYLKACGLEKFLSDYGNGSVAVQDLKEIFTAHPEMFTKIESVRL